MGRPRAPSRNWQVDVYRNPYLHTIPEDDFGALLQDVIGARAEDIQARFESGEYSRNSMGFVLLDPTAPNNAKNEDIVLAIAAVGPEGGRFVVNATAKVFEHRDHGVDCGVLVYAQNHRLADGDFRYGYSVVIDGTPVGGSGLTELEDRYQCTLLAADFNLRIGRARKGWEERVGKGRWYCNQDEPGERYADVAGSTMVSQFSAPSTV